MMRLGCIEDGRAKRAEDDVEQMTDLDKISEQLLNYRAQLVGFVDAISELIRRNQSRVRTFYSGLQRTKPWLMILLKTRPSLH